MFDATATLAACPGCGGAPRPGRTFCSRRCWLRELHGRNRGRKGPLPRPDPTPQQIARRAAAIRATWTPETELLRRTPRPVMWTVPEVRRSGG